MITPAPPSPVRRRRGFAAAAVDALLDALLPSRIPARPWLVGLSALQGSGKSTLAAQLVAAAKRRGLDAVALSLDDFYLGRRARRQLARRVHPLFATRGVPGTHDVALLAATLDALTSASIARPACLPAFDKGLDTRRPPSRWRICRQRPDLIVLEGWCVGVPAQASADLARAVNALEREEDADGCWRGHANTALATAYAPLWRRLDRLAVLQAPSFDVVARWRGGQERALHRKHAPQAMEPAALARFIAHYERLSRHALRVLPSRADVLVTLDARRRVRSLSVPARRGSSRARTVRY